ncbi:MAG: PQQ-dependent sugar dehydrogenase, partial [Pseudomonadota bacterium]|nr:PQQ-dependent sugar dehydrogenase [Pseudomonadota bacterium]
RGLSMPHTIARGPDGRIYLAEMSRILAFDPARPEAATEVIGGLPDNRLHENRHPLSSFIFDGDGALLVNVGAPSDRCLTAAGVPRRDANGQCVESGEQGMVRRYASAGPGRWSQAWTVHASGLRNSVALVRHGSGAIYQAENSVDLTTPDRPFDEINRLSPGAHYGWPYCTDMATALPGWTAAQSRCGARTAPVSLLPPHAAPLAILYYDGAMFPELRGRMLMSWHGYRRAAGRVVAVETDAAGAPLTDRRARYAIYPRGSLPYPVEAPAPRARVLTPGWSARPARHPQGSPAGMAVARDGSIWIADDRSAAILRIARD